MKRCLRFGVAGVGMLFAALSGAQEQLHDYALQLPLQLSGEGPWYRLDIPVELHFAARYGDLRDLRVFNGEGQALAYALVAGQAESTASQQEHQVKWFPLYAEEADANTVANLRVQRGTGGTLIELMDEPAQAQPALLRGWLLDASAVDDALVRLQLDWSGPQEGFQRFSIEASDDLQHWQPWGTGQLARLSFAEQRIEQQHVELPGHKARYLRLLWQSPKQAPQLSAASLRSQHTATAAAPLVWSQALGASRAGNGEYHWQLPQALALQRLQVELSQANSLAPLRVSGRREGQANWQPLAQGLLYRLPESGGEMLQDELLLPGWPVQQLRVQVDERGGGLGPEAQIKVALRASQLVFLQRGNPPYHLALGRANVQSAALPLTTLIPGYQAQRLPQLGSAKVLLGAASAVVEEQPAAPKQDWKRWSLWLVLLLGAGLLATMAISLLRRPKAE